MILIKNGWIITCDDMDTEIKVGNIIIEGNIIKEITDSEIEDGDKFDRTIDAGGKIVIPGLINGHMHSYSSFVKGLHENVPLELWMLYIMTQGTCMEPEDVYYNALLCSIEMLKSGVTSSIDHLAQGYDGLEAAMKAYEDIGMRVSIAPMITDKLYYQTIPVHEQDIPDDIKIGQPANSQDLLDTTIKLFKNWNGKHERLKVMFGPSGPQRCSDDLLKKCSDLAEEFDTGVHTHLLESKFQAKAAEKIYGNQMVVHLNEIGFLNERTSLAHSVWLNELEANIVAACGSVIVHNPWSNLLLGSGIANVNLFRKLGIKVAIGTDGANCGINLNMFESMKLAATLHKVTEDKYTNWITAKEVLHMATNNSARAALSYTEVGSLEEGKKADITILDPKRSTALVPLNDPVYQLVYGENGSGVDTVMVNGKILLENGKVLAIDEAKVNAEAAKRAKRIAEKAALQKEKNDKLVSVLNNLMYK